jgi:hypothetical protein
MRAENPVPETPKPGTGKRLTPTSVKLIPITLEPRHNLPMKRPFAATAWREGRWYVSQCPELDVASQGDTE